MLIKRLDTDRSAANVQKERVEDEKSEVLEKAQEVELILKEAEAKVAEAKPKLDKATAALNVLDRSSLSEFKMMRLEGVKKELMECI